MSIALSLLKRFWYVIPIILLGLALKMTRAELADVRAWQAEAVAATRLAANNPKLKVSRVPAQIAELGRGVDRLQAGLKRCNDSARAAADEDARRQAAAAAELRRVEQRSAARDTLIDRLKASAAAPRTPAAACAPSETLKEIWK